jgi:hypothetical protein
MKWLMMVSLALFLPRNASADDTGASKYSFSTAATYGFLVNGSRVRSSRGGGISLSFDYALDTRSSVFVNYNAFATHGGSLGSVGYKYWLTELQKLRPWVQVAAGYLWNKSTDIFPEPNHEGVEHANDVQFSFGGGVRYAIGKDIGLDASAVVFKAGAPWRWSSSSKLVSTSLGADIIF